MADPGQPGHPAAGVVADRHGAGPAVVLLHGQPGSGADWEATVPLLCGDFTVVVPDRPGYGRTGGRATGFAGNADAVIGLLDGQHIDAAIIVGHSWGGGAALAAAERHPARVAGLVLVASVNPGEPVSWDDRLLAAPVVGDLVAALTLGVAGRVLASDRVQSLVDRRLPGHPRQVIWALAGLTGARTGAAVWRSFVTEQRALLEELDGLAAGLAHLEVPATVINGTADRVVRPASAERLAAAIPGATYVPVTGAHHLLPHDHPSRIAAAVRQVATRAGW